MDRLADGEAIASRACASADSLKPLSVPTETSLTGGHSSGTTSPSEWHVTRRFRKHSYQCARHGKSDTELSAPAGLNDENTSSRHMHVTRHSAEPRSAGCAESGDSLSST